MSEPKSFEQFYEEASEMLKAREAECAALKDRSNDKGPVLRPSDSFIDRSLGPELDEKGIHAEATRLAERQMKIQAIQRGEYEAAMRGPDAAELEADRDSGIDTDKDPDKDPDRDR